MTWGLMKTFDSLNEREQEVIKDAIDLVRAHFTDHGLKLCNDDRAAIFDEACAVYYVQCRNLTRDQP